MGIHLPKQAILLIALLLSIVSFAETQAQLQPPQYEELRLDSIFPNGGQRGTSVKVEFRGVGTAFSSIKDIVVDGPAGITVDHVKSINGNTAEAQLKISPDAPLGRRWIRVLSERSGLTNFAYFVVGNLPERTEIEPNNEASMAEQVDVPVVLCGRIHPEADVDYFRFRGNKGQNLVAAIAAHSLDIHGQSRNYGIADFSLELLDGNGKTLVTAEDSLGFDPLVEYRLPESGEYLIRVQLLNYQGFTEAVYRLTLGEVPYLTAAFPPGLKQQHASQVELFGPNIPAGTKLSTTSVLSAESSNSTPQPTFLPHSKSDLSRSSDGRSYPIHHLVFDHPASSGLDIPLIVGQLPEAIEVEPNDSISNSTPIELPLTVNSRFQRLGDIDCYRLNLAAQQKVELEILAHRFLRSTVDSSLQVLDAQGKLLAENDDEVFDPGYECYQDYKTMDSKLVFTAPSSGDYYVQVRDQSGSVGPRAIYRLTARIDQPDFRLTHFPDSVPIWGPGTTAAVLVRIDRFSSCNDDIEISVEGLPAGWRGSVSRSEGLTPLRTSHYYQMRTFLTITAPADSSIGSAVPFHILGRAKRSDGSVVEHKSLPLTLYYTSDTGFFRASPVTRAVVAKSQGPWLEAVTETITLPQNGAGTLNVKVLGAPELNEMPIVVNHANGGVACGLMTPRNLPVKNGQVEVPIKLGTELLPGTYSITVAQTWRSDIRVGMPGPCTQLIKLHVLPAK